MFSKQPDNHKNNSPTIHLIVGFLGFGKTTLAKQLEKELSAKRFTHDEIMVERYGRNPDDFQAKFQEIDIFIRQQAAKTIKNGQDVIMDYGFWNHTVRDEYYKWAKTLTDNVLFHVIDCDINLAKARVLKRSQTDKDALIIDENAFNLFLTKYEPFSKQDNYPVVWHHS